MANFHEVMDMNQRTPMPGKGKKAEISTIEHKASENGGHVFTHHMESTSGAYHAPEIHTFGADEGHAALAHFAQHSGLSEHMGAEDHVEDDEDSAAGAAN